MKKKILLILILLILVGGFFIILELKYNYLTLNKNKYFDFRYFINTKSYELAKKLNIPSICNFSGIQKEDCYTYFAETKKDPKFCLELFNLENINAEYTVDPGFSVSYKPPEEREENCYLNAFSHISDTTICDKYLNQKTSTGKVIKDYCYVVAGINLKDQSICQKIIDTDIKQICNDEFYYNSAVKDLNYMTCLYIENHSREISCQEDIIDKLGNFTLCNILPHLEEPYCYEKYAKLKKDYSICLKIKNEFEGDLITTTIRNECLMEVAISTQNISICEYITDKDDKNICIKKINKQ